MSLTKAHNRMIENAAVNAVDFGADPTGVNDSYDAITAALAASQNVFLPEGTYKISAMVQMPARGSLIGATKVSTILQTDGAISGISTHNECVIKNINVLTNLSMTTDHAAVEVGYYQASGNFVLENVSVNQNNVPATNHACYGFRYGIAFIATMTNCYARGCFIGEYGTASEVPTLPRLGGLNQVINAIVQNSCSFAYNTYGSVKESQRGCVYNSCSYENNDRIGLVISNTEGGIYNGCYFEYNNRNPGGPLGRHEIMIDASDAVQSEFYSQLPVNTVRDNISSAYPRNTAVIFKGCVFFNFLSGASTSELSVNAFYIGKQVGVNVQGSRFHGFNEWDGLTQRYIMFSTGDYRSTILFEDITLDDGAEALTYDMFQFTNNRTNRFDLVNFWNGAYLEQTRDDFRFFNLTANSTACVGVNAVLSLDAARYLYLPKARSYTNGRVIEVSVPNTVAYTLYIDYNSSDTANTSRPLVNGSAAAVLLVSGQSAKFMSNGNDNWVLLNTYS